MDNFLETLSKLPGLLTSLEAQLDANTRALETALELISNTRLYEKDAASYLGVEPKTMYHYRQKGLTHEKVGRIISYVRKDLDAWRAAGRVHGTR